MKYNPYDSFDCNWSEYYKTDNHMRNIETLAENSKDKKMTRKVDTYEYEALETCIKTDQVPSNEIAELFTDKAFYNWYAKRNFQKDK